MNVCNSTKLLKVTRCYDIAMKHLLTQGMQVVVYEGGIHHC